MMSDDLRDNASARYAKARSKVTEATAATKVKANAAATKTRASAAKAAKTTSDGLSQNPLAAMLGGLALGAIAAALLPKTRREDDMLGSVGSKVRGAAREATKAARAAGKEQLDTLGVSTDAARDQIRGLADKIGKAATTASTAAADALKKR
jgi:hypothetical protein